MISLFERFSEKHVVLVSSEVFCLFLVNNCLTFVHSLVLAYYMEVGRWLRNFFLQLERPYVSQMSASECLSTEAPSAPLPHCP